MIAERVQQSKLAALGRLQRQHRARDPQSGRRDEPRAPAAARIADADADDGDLTDIIEKNGVRVSQIIENVLQLSRRDTTRQERMELARVARGVHRASSAQTLELDAARGRARDPRRRDIEVRDRSVAPAPGALEPVRQRASSTRRRDGARSPSSSRMRTHRHLRPAVPRSGRPRPGHRAAQCRADLRAVLHEPAQAAPGLGLFISRELCQTNGAAAALRAARRRWQHFPHRVRRSAALGSER